MGMEPRSAHDPEDTAGAALAAVALGREPPDCLVEGGTLVNVYAGELLSGWSVAIKGERVAAVGPDLGAGPHTMRIDARGRFVLPGLIDAHTHLDFLQEPATFLRAAIPTGVTAIVTETTGLASVGGAGAVTAFLDAIPTLPIEIYGTAPMITYFCTDRGDGGPMVSAGELSRLLDHPRILGLGEVYWSHLPEHWAALAPILAKARRLRKTIEGHGAGARGPKLAALAAAGITSCHEPITADEVLERLRLGFYTMVREGSVRRDITQALGALATEPLDWRRLILATDGVWPVDLLAHGYVDGAVRAAVAAGLPPVRAIQAATLNPAEHFGLADRMGGLAPGRLANLLLVRDLEEMRPDLVMSRGVVVAEKGRVTIPLPERAIPAGALPPVRLPRRLAAEDFRVPGPKGDPAATVRAIRYAGDIVTEAVHRRPPTADGHLLADPARDLLKAVAMDRRGQGLRAIGFVEGFGLRAGAVASSLGFDTLNLAAVGASDADLAAAFNRLADLAGGIVVVEGGRIMAELALPVGGIMTTDPVEASATRLGEVEEALRHLGCGMRQPLLALHVLTFTAIPALRLRERGLVDVKANRVVDLFGGD